MGVDLFLTLLMSSTIATIFLADALKTILDASGTRYRTNAVVLDSAMISTTGIGILYRIPFGLGFQPIQIYRLFLLIVCTWFLSMLVYDKIKQTKRQYKEYKENKGGKTKCVKS